MARWLDMSLARLTSTLLCSLALAARGSDNSCAGRRGLQPGAARPGAVGALAATCDHDSTFALAYLRVTEKVKTPTQGAMIRQVFRSTDGSAARDRWCAEHGWARLGRT